MLSIIEIINRLFSWNNNRVQKKKRLKIYNQYKKGSISYEEYVKHRKELEEEFKNERSIFSTKRN